MQQLLTQNGQSKVRNNRIRKKNIRIILQAAEFEFANSGFKGASIRNIAERAGIPKANVHYYFHSKSELYDAVLAQTVNVWEPVFNHLTVDSDPVDALKQFILAKIQLMFSSPSAVRIFTYEILHKGQLNGTHLQLFNQWMKEKSKVIQAWIDQGRLKPVEPHYLLFVIWATAQYYTDYATQIADIVGKSELQESDMQAYTNTVCQLVLSQCNL